MTDPIADFITRIKNALLAQHESIRVPYSRVKEDIARILLEEGYVDEVTVVDTQPFKELELHLRYVGKLPAVNDVKRLSRPGRRLYSSARQIPRALGGYGITILSTNKGIMTDKKARQENVGGELLCQIW